MIGWRAFARLRGRFHRRWMIGAGLAAVAVAGGAAVAVFVVGGGGSGAPPGPPRAVIVDQLASTNRNPGFVAEATQMLQSAGYQVDYVPPEQVNVEFYRQLPTRGYTFLIIRSHSYGTRTYRDPTTGQPSELKEVGLFTTEPYSVFAHSAEQAKREVDAAVYNGSSTRVFGIAPAFVSEEMRGAFHHATLLLMGCDGLSTDTLAKALQNRGIARFIGWDDQVTAQHTDVASLDLLKKMLTEHVPATQAVAQEAAAAGPDPVYGGKLATYP